MHYANYVPEVPDMTPATNLPSRTVYMSNTWAKLWTIELIVNYSSLVHQFSRLFPGTPEWHVFANIYDKAWSISIVIIVFFRIQALLKQLYY